MTPEEAKKLAAGPLGDQQARFPLRFAKAVFFGELPSKDRPVCIRNGTITLVDLGSGPIGITCAHVIETYRNMMRELAREHSARRELIFQVGDALIDPTKQIIDENPGLDLATIRFTQQQISEIAVGGDIGSQFFRPVAWPSPPASVGEGALFGGYPEAYREMSAHDALGFPSWSSGGTPVTTVSADRFSCQFERDGWIRNFGSREGMQLSALSGLSGGPAFVHRGLHFDSVGIIYQFSPSWDILFLRPSGLIDANGLIATPT
jgi:hypothetical protein